ncbi:MAG: hypothetical protein A2029_13715 [Chloroflexi bacterium RBG_19FT_COMBO_47_9]|nr:MAG: hypothetical protein A2029_13715 [Chloroflexi bacterium RBG_19FT_COMBO_47_9]
MKKYLTLILSLVIIAIIHEGLHALIANAYGEYNGFRLKPYGLEVFYKTPVEERSGIKWGFISGTSNVATVLLGYLLFAFKNQFYKQQNNFIRSLFYWLIICLLLLDPLNISIGPFIYGGDANGIATGFGINRWVVQGIFIIIFFINRELVAQKVIPSFGIMTRHPLFRPWITHP